MAYQFPVINHIDDVREAIAYIHKKLDMTTFVESVKPEYTAVDYVVSVPGMYPEPNTGDAHLDRLHTLLRECRGLLFDNHTGKVIGRRLQKFFNVNEKPESMAHKIDLSRPHIILEKLDGSLISPFPIAPRGVEYTDVRQTNYRIGWGSKMGETPVSVPVAEFVKLNKQIHYEELAEFLIQQNANAMFEWCSRKQPIVIDYKVDQLVLLAIRDNVTGRYWSFEEMTRLGEAFHVPVVKPFQFAGTLQELIEYTKGIRNAEGFIIRFDDGEMHKLKGDEYCMLHSSKDMIRREKDVVKLIIDNKVDDVLPSLDLADATAIGAFQEKFFENVSAYARDLESKVIQYKLQFNEVKKDFAIALNTDQLEIEKRDRGLAFGVWDGSDARESILSIIRAESYSQPRLNVVKYLFGSLNWSDYKYTIGELED